MGQLLIVFATINGAIAVMLGAFGAHALKASLSASQLQTWQTAVQYHFIHVLALIALALCLKLVEDTVTGRVAGIAFAVGLLFFSGSLYWLALGGPRWLGPVTPLGGLAFIIGWLAFSVYGIRKFY